jgi:hypothetical protein
MVGIRIGHSGLQTHQRCMRFDCDERIIYSAKHPSLYCSAHCRVSANREIAWLNEEVVRIDERLANAPLTRSERIDLVSRRGLVTWHLRHYAIAGQS